MEERNRVLEERLKENATQLESNNRIINELNK
jgi:hypothetical protein